MIYSNSGDDETRNGVNDKDFVGGNHHLSNTHKGVDRPEKVVSTMDIGDDIVNPNIFRYKFSHDFTGELFKFSKIHQYDHRSDFKEAWKVWLDDNADVVTTESRRMTNSGYGGDVMDKMFKSARYYYRKKSTETKKPVERRKYTCVQKSVLDAIDEHIKNTDYKPSTGFDAFCDLNRKLVEDEIIRLNEGEDNLDTLDDVRKKIKKTYKNRYFLIFGKKIGVGI